jgi:hypothetical protein
MSLEQARRGQQKDQKIGKVLPDLRDLFVLSSSAHSWIVTGDLGRWFHTQQAAAGAQPRLAGKPNRGRVVAEDFENFQLVFGGRLEELASLENEHAARTAAGASARKRDGGGVLVAEIHERACARCFYREGRLTIERLEDDRRHSVPSLLLLERDGMFCARPVLKCGGGRSVKMRPCL